MLQAAHSLDLAGYFGRTVTAAGYVEDRKRRVTRRYTASFEGHVNQSTLSIHEILRYSDGEQETRDWQIIQQAPNRYQVTADFIVGTGVIDVTDTSARWQYHGLIPYRDGQVKLWFDDLMVLTGEDQIVSSIVVSKFGFTLARSQTFYQP